MRPLSWTGTAAVALLAAVVACVTTGFVAERWASWHGWDQREGATGYVIVALGLLGGVAGGLAGLLAARHAGGVGAAGAARALALATLPLLGLAGVVAAGARATADVSPTLDGEPLHLLVQVAWPASEQERPTAPPGRASVWLGVGRDGAPARLQDGPLWIDDAHRADGRWVADGAVAVWTEHGPRAVGLRVGDAIAWSIPIPLGRRPTAADRAWSAWTPAVGDGPRVRYRVQARARPLRTDTLGPFAVATTARRFDRGPDGYGRPRTVTADATLDVTYRGVPLVRALREAGVAGLEPDAQVRAALALPGAMPALLVRVYAPGAPGRCFLVAADGDGVRATPLPGGEHELRVAPLAAGAATEGTAPPRMDRGLFDRHALAGATVLRVNDVVLDVPTRQVRPR
jgi:hypothetical protein